MKNYLSRIREIKNRFRIPEEELFMKALSGTNYKVFLSNSYVMRFRDDNPKLLLREVDFLKELDHPMIPRILQSGEINKLPFMIENRLKGETLNLIWKNLSVRNKKSIIGQVVEFLQYQKHQTKKYVYSVKTGKKYERFLDYLTDNLNQKIINIKKFEETNKIVEELLLIINNYEIKNLFIIETKNSLVHGDLIIHNLLTDGEGLTGVLDWELAAWGDPDYDLFRLFYYQECAKAYQEQGTDETFESDYMDKLITAILKSNLIKDRKIFQKKYQFVRAIFYIDALHWATNSNSPQENINELIVKWSKKRAGLSA